MPYTYEQALEIIEDEEIKSAIASKFSETDQKITKLIGEVRAKSEETRKLQAELASAQSETQSLLEGSDPSISINDVVTKVSKEKRDLQLANQRLKSDNEKYKIDLESNQKELTAVRRKYTLQEVSRLTGFRPNVLANIAAIDVDNIEISSGKVYYTGDDGTTQEIEQAIANDPELSVFLSSLREQNKEQPRSPSLPTAPSNPQPSRSNTNDDLVSKYLQGNRANFNRG